MINKNLYESIIYDIAKIVKLQLNEMSKNISYRNIDRKLWLSVASIYSKNKSTEAEFVKPLRKYTKDDLLQRYVAALLISKKQCPKSIKDIETIKTFKLYAQKALELGATINDIQELYNQNISDLKAKQDNSTSTTSLTLDNPNMNNKVNKPNKSNKYQDILDGFIKNFPERNWVNLPTYKSNLEEKPSYKLCKQPIELYLKNIIRKSNNSFQKFGELIQKDFKQFFKIMNITPEYYLQIKKYFGDTYLRYSTYSNYFGINIDENKIEMYLENEPDSFNNKNIYKTTYTDKDLFKNLTAYNVNYACQDKKVINVFNEFVKDIFINVVVPYIKYKKSIKEEGNKANIKEIYTKYNMSEQNKYKWCINNLKSILYNNPDLKIYIKFTDWSGGITSLEYNSDKKKYFAHIWCDNGSTDLHDTDYLDNLFRNKDKYKYSFKNYSCIIYNMDELYLTIYNKILELIKEGKLN